MPLKKYLDYDGLDYLIQRIPRTKIRVTFDDVFAGETATCSMGTTTYTKTVPATEPYELVFPINELGTWTIATSYLGDDYGTTIEVTAIGQTATGHVSYETTPEGATVLPTDDIQTWLACANITDKSYTTLAEVLADRETFEILIADSNACDYMARSTSWAGSSEGLVPVMTSDTTPSGTVTYSSQNTGADTLGYYAFDGNDSTGWGTNSASSTGQWVEYEFASSVTFNKISYKIGMLTGSLSATSCAIQAYINDEWTPIATETYASAIDKTVDINTVTTTKIRVIATGSNSNFYVNRLQIYLTKIIGNPTAMSLIGKYDYCSIELLSNATWKEAIVNSDYWESVCNGSVPKMTSNTAPEGECFSGSDYSASFPPYLAFDRTSSTYWLWGAIGTNNNYIGYRFPSARKVYAMKAIFSKEGNPTNVTLNIQGSVDGTSDYVSLASFDTSSWVVGDNEVFVLIENPSNYLSYRILANGVMLQGSGIGFSTKDIQFYGRASAQTNIIHSAPNDTIYMLENGSQVVLTTTNSDGIGTLDFTQFMDGTYTLYSSVAKDPDNLSNDFSKSIRITKTSYGGTTEVYLMPDTVKTLYWFGYMSDNCEELSAANGWTCRSNWYWKVPTYNTNDITVSGGSSGQYFISGVGSKNKIPIGSIAKAICTSISVASQVSVFLANFNNGKAIPSNGEPHQSAIWNTVNVSEVKSITTDIEDYITVLTWVPGRNAKINALWYE